MNHINARDADLAVDADALDARLAVLVAAARSFVARDRIEQQARQWLTGVPWIVHEGHWTIARVLATDLALITPSMTGATAYDRLFRSRKDWSAIDLVALSLLRRGAMRLARVKRGRFEDLATGEARPLVPSAPSRSVTDSAVIGFFGMMPDGAAIALGALLELDTEALAVASGFFRPGRRGLTNPVRCAEAVYRHMVRSGMAAAEDSQPELPFDPEHDPLDALAADWAALDGEPGAEESARVTPFIGAGALLNALISVGIARDGGAARLAAAYRRIAARIIEFMANREVIGSMLFSLDRAAQEVDAAVARGRCGSATKALFNDLRERARLSAGGRARDDADLDKLVQRIRGLRAKTVEQGCTEQEALAAAEKVAELLDRYGLTLSELDLRKQRCEGVGIDTGRRRRAPIDDCIGAIARFFDCRAWAETLDSGELRHIFFGLPADVQAAAYLYDLVELAFASETTSFRADAYYQSLDSGERRSATNSFHVGLANGIIARLGALRRARDASAHDGGGRALVPVKQSILDEEMERLGLTLRVSSAPRRRVIADAFSAGREAGEKFEYTPAIQAA